MAADPRTCQDGAIGASPRGTAGKATPSATGGKLLRARTWPMLQSVRLPTGTAEAGEIAMTIRSELYGEGYFRKALGGALAAGATGLIPTMERLQIGVNNILADAHQPVGVAKTYTQAHVRVLMQDLVRKRGRAYEKAFHAGVQSAADADLSATRAEEAIAADAAPDTTIPGEKAGSVSRRTITSRGRSAPRA